MYDHRHATSVEDAATTPAALADGGAHSLTHAQLAAMVPLRTLRGRGKSGNPKLLRSTRYSPEVVNYFKTLGEGWRSPMDRVLRDQVSRYER